MAFLDKLNQVAKNLGDKTNDAIEATRLHTRSNAEKAAAAEDLRKIGEHYYALFAVSGQAAPEILELCQSAKAHYDAAAGAQAEIERIKTENEAEKAAPAPKRKCPACGAAGAPGVKFCPECGQRMEE